MFDDEGRPVIAKRAHDVSEFLGVVERYGPDAVHSNVRRLIDVSKRKPILEAAKIHAACGTCRAAA